VRFSEGTPTSAGGISADVLFLISYNFTYSSSMRLSKAFTGRVALLILPHGIVKQGSLFFTPPSYVGMRRLWWWTPIPRHGSFLSSPYNSGVIFAAFYDQNCTFTDGLKTELSSIVIPPKRCILVSRWIQPYRPSHSGFSAFTHSISLGDVSLY
jgi:hypothetical protein